MLVFLMNCDTDLNQTRHEAGLVYIVNGAYCQEIWEKFHILGSKFEFESFLTKILPKVFLISPI